MNEPLILARQFSEYRGCPIGRVIIDDDDVEGKIGLLSERAAHGFGNRALAVAHRDDDGSAHRKTFITRRSRLELRREVRIEALQMARGNGFHLDLKISPPWIDIIEL